jgi:hypothetical protein
VPPTLGFHILITFSAHLIVLRGKMDLASLLGERRLTMPWVTALVLRADVEHAVNAMHAGHDATTRCPIARALGRVLGLGLGKMPAGYDGVEA